MEAQVENNAKNKQTNKQRKEKKKLICTDWIQSLKNCGNGENIRKKKLTTNWCPWPNTQALLYFVQSK